MLIRVAGGAIAVVMAFVVGLSILVAVVLDGTDDAQAATTSTSAPTGPNAEWDPGLILPDGVFRDWSSMTVDDDIQTFLDHQGCEGDGCVCARAPTHGPAPRSRGVIRYRPAPDRSRRCCRSSPPGAKSTRRSQLVMSSYGNRNAFRLFQQWFGSTGGGKITETAAGQTVPGDGVDITIPTGPAVDPAVAGRTITAPTPAVAQGLAAGFAVLSMPTFGAAAAEPVRTTVARAVVATTTVAVARSVSTAVV